MIELAFEDQRALVAETGAALREYEVGGRPAIEPSARGYSGAVLAPWPNRVVDGRWTWRGRTYRLAVNEPDRGHALHGLVHALPWRVAERTAEHVVLEVQLDPHPGWPFPMRFTASYRLGRAGLVSHVTAQNTGAEACPYGVATHPYAARRGAAVEDIVVHLDAAAYLATDDRLAPTEKRPTAGTPYDFADGAALDGRRVDNAFTDLASGEAHIVNPDGFTTVLWGDESVRWWQLFVEDVIAVEPMTCAPDALNSGDGLVVLDPGDAHTMTWGVRLSPTEPRRTQPRT
ncbi:MAG TPA: aldose 1-epimerase family protein [Acidimicrobiales bacterium]|nr:aldose 1-epimerase family protein [Acidimicrobiales bacterium]